MTAIALLHKDKVIDALSKGQTLDSLNLGVSRQAISRALKDCPEYQDALIEYHAARLDKAEALIEEALDNVDVARARALHSAYSWRAEREQSRIWGNQQQSNVQQSPTVVINIGSVQPGHLVEQSDD